MDTVGEHDPYKVDILKAMRWCKAAWHNVASESIRKCWRHSGILPADVKADSGGSNALDEADSLLASTIAELNVSSPFTVDEVIEADSDIAPLEEVIDDEMILSLVTAEDLNLKK